MKYRGFQPLRVDVFEGRHLHTIDEMVKLKMLLNRHGKPATRSDIEYMCKHGVIPHFRVRRDKLYRYQYFIDPKEIIYAAQYTNGLFQVTEALMKRFGLDA